MFDRGGGWTLCAKYDRDNSAGRISVDDGFGRSAVDEAALADVTTFNVKQFASQVPTHCVPVSFTTFF